MCKTEPPIKGTAPKLYSKVFSMELLQIDNSLPGKFQQQCWCQAEFETGSLHSLV